MASLDDRRPSQDIVQDDIVGALTVDVCTLPYFTADRLLVTRVHRITTAHSYRTQIVGSAAGTGADDTLPRVESIFAQVFPLSGARVHKIGIVETLRMRPALPE